MPRRAIEWTTDDRVARRWTLYGRALSVWRDHGYRGATMKALAAACGTSIPALYRYFPSKRAFALFPLVLLYPELHGASADVAAADPRPSLESWIEAAIAEMPKYTLALRLAREIVLDGDEERRLEANLIAHVEIVAGLAQAAAPHLGARAARELAGSMIAIATASALTGMEIEPASQRRRLTALLRGYGVAIAMGPPAQSG